ncbi:MAG: FtsX-like permease family protein [Firmicutes bacterium]|nr:FtsX-like permease family protein [Bacillota bacterium]
MDLMVTMQIAWKSLLVNKMRSILTMLGIIIGVAAVIVMVSLSQGSSAGITERISSMGANLLTVTAGGSSGPVRGTSTARLTVKDADAISELPLVKYVAPEASSSYTVTVGSSTWTSTTTGTTPELQKIKDWDTASGEFFAEDDVQKGTTVAVLGNTVVENLFPSGKALGEKIKINGLTFTVVGTLVEKGTSGMGSDQDDCIYIPITTAQQRLMGSGSLRQINVQADSQEALTPLKESISALLRQRHRLAATADDDFNIRDMTQLLSTIEDTTKIMTFLLGGIAGISLIVGGIGIMNIMLVSVTERTREIGIRMAVGATTRDILTQFLIEALLLSLMGGIAGILIGWVGTGLLSWLASLKMEMVPWIVAIALGFSMMVGLFFGYYPARKAANSNPIEALRFE